MKLRRIPVARPHGFKKGAGFIVFEGGEKAGKTTQILRAKVWLESLDYEALITHEPGGGDQKIREKLLRVDRKLTPEEELNLFCEDRKLHIANLIKPALEAGKIVLCDRFSGSTIAYQGYGRGLALELVKRKDAEARQGVQPNLVLLFDVDPRTALGRALLTTRFDNETLEFHERVRKGFLAQAKEDPFLWRVIDASKPIEEVWVHVSKFLRESISGTRV